jgi:hypothetical protein
LSRVLKIHQLYGMKCDRVENVMNMSDKQNIFNFSRSQDQRMTSATAERLKNDRANNNISTAKSKQIKHLKLVNHERN